MINKIFGNAPLNDTRQVNIEFLWELSNNCELFSVSKKRPNAVLSLTVNNHRIFWLIVYLAARSFCEKIYFGP